MRCVDHDFLVLACHCEIRDVSFHNYHNTPLPRCQGRAGEIPPPTPKSARTPWSNQKADGAKALDHGGGALVV